MTTVVVNAGACGFLVVVNVAREGAVPGKPFRVTVESECEHVRSLAGALPALARADAVAGDNPVYREAARHLKHMACPVPSAILKALEVEAGLNVPRNVSMTFRPGRGEPGAPG